MNRVRGESCVTLENKSYTLCLTLGALAEIESGLGAQSIDQIDQRLAAPRIADLIVILGALLRGGGHDLSDQDIGMMQIDFKHVSAAITETFKAAGLGAKDNNGRAGMPDVP